MKKKNFSTTIAVKQTAKALFEAINNPQNWWCGEVNGSAQQVNDVFTYRYETMHFSTQKVVEMIPNQKVVWQVTDSVINYADDKNEWTGTRIEFDIIEKNGKTQLRFTHNGLTPQVECFDSCSYSWTQIIQQSLFSLVTTGEGLVLDL